MIAFTIFVFRLMGIKFSVFVMLLAYHMEEPPDHLIGRFLSHRFLIVVVNQIVAGRTSIEYPVP
jgi:hypothetical protein